MSIAEDISATVPNVVAARLKIHARKCRGIAALYVVFLFFIFIMALSLFLMSPSIDRALSDDLGMAELNRDLRRVASELEEKRRAPPTESPSEKVDRLTKANDLEVERSRINDSIVDLIKLNSNRENYLGTMVGRVVLAFGAVLLSVMMIQVMVSTIRYYLRSAEHYELISDAVMLCADDLSQLKQMREGLLPAGLDFGPEIASPYDKALELVRDAVKKIPGK